MGSRWAWARARGGAPPALDLRGHRALADLVRDLVVDGLLTGVHDVGEGGLALALAEMAVRSGVGFTVGGVADARPCSPSRRPGSWSAWRPTGPRPSGNGATRPASPTALGGAGGDRLVVEGLLDLSLAEAVAAWRDRLPVGARRRIGPLSAPRRCPWRRA